MDITCVPTFERVATIGRTEPVVLCGTCGAIVPVPRGRDAFGGLAPMPGGSYVPAHAVRVPALPVVIDLDADQGAWLA